MKLVKFVLVSLISVSAFASAPRPVLEVRTTGGLAPMPTRGIRVLQNGAILSIKGPEVTEIGRLTLQKANLINNVAEILQGTLTDLNPGQSMCMDAPVTSFRVFKSNGQALEFVRFANCHKYGLQNENGANSMLLEQLLTGIRTLDQLIVPVAQ